MPETILERHHPLQRLTLVGVGAIILSTLVAWAWLPEPIAVQWSLEGSPTNQMSKWLWLLIMCAVWAFVSTALIGLRGVPDWRRVLMFLVAGILFAAHVTTLENNLGADSWRAAEPLDLGVALALVLVGTVAVWVLHVSSRTEGQAWTP